MEDRLKNNGTGKNSSALSESAASFFGNLERDGYGRKLLNEQNHRIEFDLLDGRPFHVEIRDGYLAVHDAIVTPSRYDCDDVIHFQIHSETLQKLFDGKIRFTDAFVPTDQDGNDSIILMECTLFKWSVLSWVGRIFRSAQILKSGIKEKLSA